jgi:hypothetical protein
MTHFLEFLFSDRAALLGALLMWIFSSAVQSMPEPRDCDGRGYLFLYKWTHALGANWQQFGTATVIQKLCRHDPKS